MLPSLLILPLPITLLLLAPLDLLLAMLAQATRTARVVMLLAPLISLLAPWLVLSLMLLAVLVTILDILVATITTAATYTALPLVHGYTVDFRQLNQFNQFSQFNQFNGPCTQNILSSSHLNIPAATFCPVGVLAKNLEYNG